MRDAADRAARHVLVVQDHHAFADVLREIADALEIVRNSDGGDDLSQIRGGRMPLSDDGDRFFLDLPLPQVEDRVFGNHPQGTFRIPRRKSIDRFDDLPFGNATHLGD